MLSIVIPTLNAERTLPTTLAALQAWTDPCETVVADGGSTDATVAAAEAAGARVVTGASGRGAQLAAGAAAARGDRLLFLHADTVLSADWPAAVRTLSAVPDERAGYFRFRLDDPSPTARTWERRVAWRCRAFALPYGDQGLVIGRKQYERLGGYAPLALMEDVDLVRRIVRDGGRRALAALDADAVTSAEKFRRDGYVRRSARNLTCLGLWLAGVPPRRIKALYG
jgi:rSAM/selenodomain-associated transferase 2